MTHPNIEQQIKEPVVHMPIDIPKTNVQLSNSPVRDYSGNYSRPPTLREELDDAPVRKTGLIGNDRVSPLKFNTRDDRSAISPSMFTHSNTLDETLLLTPQGTPSSNRAGFSRTDSRRRQRTTNTYHLDNHISDKDWK
uniref:Uncharacterized protein LOC102808139 n=1 Tax=Saccoglossus kowalevskii TaxID=10224 RepID=A0ABM0MBN3_SACKO|nr:PREDICTED: uncharacterized protein LOC102808139 [Saccoglossus kowalevskii]